MGPFLCSSISTSLASLEGGEAFANRISFQLLSTTNSGAEIKHTLQRDKSLFYLVEGVNRELLEFSDCNNAFFHLALN